LVIGYKSQEPYVLIIFILIHKGLEYNTLLFLMLFISLFIGLLMNAFITLICSSYFASYFASLIDIAESWVGSVKDGILQFLLKQYLGCYNPNSLTQRLSEP